MFPKLIKRRQVAEAPVEDAMEAYAHWRQECMLVGDAYGRWAGAPAPDARLAFAAYVAALDREEQAEKLYANLIGQASRPVADESHRGGWAVRA